jgi:TPR repeat protein
MNNIAPPDIGRPEGDIGASAADAAAERALEELPGAKAPEARQPETGQPESEQPESEPTDSEPRRQAVRSGPKKPGAQEPEPATDEAPAGRRRWLAAIWTFLKSPLSNLFGPVAAILFLLFAGAIIREAFRDVAVIRPIAVPGELADKGLTPEVVAQRLLDQIESISHRNEIVRRPFLKAPRSFSIEQGQLDMQVPGLGLSFRSALSYLRGMVGRGEAEVAGEIVQDGKDHFVLRLRVTTQTREFADVSVGLGDSASLTDAPSFDDLFRAAAARAVRILDPYTLAVYYLDIEKSRVPEVVQYCEEKDPTCRPWVAMLKGLVHTAPPELDQAIRNYDHAVGALKGFPEAWPARGIAYINLADSLLRRSRAGRSPSGIAAARSQYERAVAAYRTALWLFQRGGRADRSISGGLAVAAYDQFSVGRLYQKGIGVTPDDRPDCRRAGAWFRRAAERGDAWAQNSLGDLYAQLDGRPCADAPPQDFAEAIKWYERAAQQGQVYAQRHLGEILARGLGPDGPERDTAILWLTRAAVRGDAQACYDLGEMYLTGIDGKPDPATAYFWFSLASRAQASPDLLARAESLAEATASKLSEVEKSKGISQVHDWYLGRRDQQ